jgi:hypothetical protein
MLCSTRRLKLLFAAAVPTLKAEKAKIATIARAIIIQGFREKRFMVLNLL